MLRASNDDLEARVQQRTADLSQANEQLATLAGIDPLTDLYNRRGWFEIAQREFARARRSGHGLALMMIDLDHFKTVNDRYGHLAGDEALKRCAAVLRKAIRPSDSCGRYGGEEFVVVTPETDLAGASALAKRIVDAVRDESLPSRLGMFNVTASIGVTILGREDAGLDEVLHRADAALYEAKLAGRNRFVAIAPNPE
jgi:diguanylate cyclase (GGDEF)-like protein